MHNAALATMGLAEEWRYQLLPVPPDAFAETVRGLRAAGFVGANVTIPHKEAALKVATDATDAARAIGAANTLTFGEDGQIHADNTDAPGLLAALPTSPSGNTALILGAGGSARAAAWALRSAGAQVSVWNRTAQRSHALATDLGVEAVDTPQGADLLVHCTSIGLGGEDAAAALHVGDMSAYATIVDLVYTPGGTPLLHAAQAAGCITVDGLEILVRQGALSLERWTGRPAPLDEMRTAAAG